MTGEVERRFSALAVADDASVRELAECILEVAGDVEVLSGPRAATMLVEMTESVQEQRFYLGEVVVSEASVSVQGSRGDALVIGRDLERAVAVAVCDAAAGAGVLADEVRALVERSESAAAAARRRESATVAATKVSFEVIG